MNVKQVQQLYEQGYNWSEIEDIVIQMREASYEGSAQFEEDQLERNEIASMEHRSSIGDYWRNDNGEYCFG